MDDDKESEKSETNTSSFPLFNLEALKQGFPSMPNLHPISLHVPSTQDIFRPTEAFKPKEKSEPEPQPGPKKRGRKPKKKASIEYDSPEATMKDILENEQTGIPMEADIKMKEQKLAKMREGKARKKKGKAVNSEETEENKPESLLDMKSVAGEPQTIFGSDESALLPVRRVVIKDGKPVLEDIEIGTTGDITRRDNLMVVSNSKPHKVSSMSFRKKTHTKQWAPEETKKFYKAIELFGTEFSLIAKLFPTRNRNQMKNKLRKEEKENPAQVEEAFKKHELSHRKSLIHRIGRVARKELKTDPDQIPHLDAFGTGDSNRQNSRYRSISNCSLDSVDMKIVDDLKGIFAGGVKSTMNDPFYIQLQQKNEPLLPLMQDKGDEHVDIDDLEETSPSSRKESKGNDNKVEAKMSVEKEPTPQKSNLLLGLLKK